MILMSVSTGTLIKRICDDNSDGIREGSVKCFEVFIANIVTRCPSEANDLLRLKVAMEPPSFGG
jgi:hypothetical protein